MANACTNPVFCPAGTESQKSSDSRATLYRVYPTTSAKVKIVTTSTDTLSNGFVSTSLRSGPNGWSRTIITETNAKETIAAIKSVFYRLSFSITEYGHARLFAVKRLTDGATSCINLVIEPLSPWQTEIHINHLAKVQNHSEMEMADMLNDVVNAKVCERLAWEQQGWSA